MPFTQQLINLCASLLLLIAFAMLTQRRLLSLINLFAMQGAMLALNTAIVAYSSRPSNGDSPHSGPAHGNGRSYGDVCLNADGMVLLTRRLDKFMAFDRVTGRLTCEAGVLLEDILALTVPHGWFLPVTPGTRYVTLGGAIANDVHGKNHHVAGSFGHHVLRLCLRRSDGSEIVCGPTLAPVWFSATVAGLGLTGLITWAEIQLLRVPSEWMLTRAHRFETLEEFWHLSAEAESTWPYAAAWVDCVSAGVDRVRGLLLCGAHAEALSPRVRPRDRSWRIPVDPPFSLVNTFSVRAFNALYYRLAKTGDASLGHYIPFLYPRDNVLNWNGLYGPAGFLQYQCVLPPGEARDALRSLLARIAASGQASFLSVLKRFGDMPPPGMLSFARPGVTLDFPNRGKPTFKLLDALDEVVMDAHGAVYPAKDARMSPRMFRAGFPALEAFARFVDPGFSSSFWRRTSA
jgi:FAD/FMN-containing dehydrogenase